MAPKQTYYCPIVMEPTAFQPNSTYDFNLPWYQGTTPAASGYLAAADKINVAQAMAELQSQKHPAVARAALIKKVLDFGSAKDFQTVLAYFDPAQPFEFTGWAGLERSLPLKYYLNQISRAEVAASPDQRVKVLLLLQAAIPDDLFAALDISNNGLKSLVEVEFYRRDLIIPFAWLLQLSREVGLSLVLLENNIRLGARLSPSETQQLILTMMATFFNLEVVWYLVSLYPDQLPPPNQLLDLLFRDKPAVDNNDHLIECFSRNIFTNLDQDDYLQRALDNNDTKTYNILEALIGHDDD